MVSAGQEQPGASGTTVLRVLQAVGRPTPRTNPFISQLAASLPPAARVQWFSWRTALFGRYDVVHAHWPELRIRRSNRARTWASRLAFALWLVRLKALRTPVVRTVHNPQPHEPGGRAEQMLLRAFDARTVTWITMASTPWTPPHGRSVTIPHGDYKEWFSAHEVPAAVPSRLLYFGLIRPYKGVDQLLDAFAQVPGDVSLRIVGHPEDDAARRLVEERAARDPRLTAHLAYVDDATLAHEIGQSQLVVLPYRSLHNSGSLLLALSLGRPVLVPAGPTADELSHEVGPDWVLSYSGELAPIDLVRALAETEPLQRAGKAPDLSAREWGPLGRALYAQYLAAVNGR